MTGVSVRIIGGAAIVNIKLARNFENMQTTI